MEEEEEEETMERDKEASAARRNRGQLFEKGRSEDIATAE